MYDRESERAEDKKQKEAKITHETCPNKLYWWEVEKQNLHKQNSNDQAHTVNSKAQGLQQHNIQTTTENNHNREQPQQRQRDLKRGRFQSLPRRH